MLSHVVTIGNKLFLEENIVAVFFVGRCGEIFEVALLALGKGAVV